MRSSYYRVPARTTKFDDRLQTRVAVGVSLPDKSGIHLYSLSQVCCPQVQTQSVRQPHPLCESSRLCCSGSIEKVFPAVPKCYQKPLHTQETEPGCLLTTGCCRPDRALHLQAAQR